VAANSRRTYEVTMGGTMIAVCNGLPYVFGSMIGAVLVMVSNVIGLLYVQHIFVLLISFIGVLPFLLEAIDDWYYLKTPKKQERILSDRIN